MFFAHLTAAFGLLFILVTGAILASGDNDNFFPAGLIILGFTITPFSFCLCVIHGLVVGIVWGKVDPQPTEEGFRTGVNLE